MIKQKVAETHAQPAKPPARPLGSSPEVSDAQEIFESMKTSEVMPNHVTYSALGLLDVCFEEVIVECLLFIDRILM